MIHEYSDGEDETGADCNLRRIADGIAERGGKPYVIPLGADHPPVGPLGYVEDAAELITQADAMDVTIDTAVVPAGIASTHVGMLAGMKAMGSPIRVLGICVSCDAGAQGPRVLKRTRETLELADL